MEKTITVGQLREHLKMLPDDYDLFFGNGNLEFFRTKMRGDKLVQVEFTQSTDGLPDAPFVAR